MKEVEVRKFHRSLGMIVVWFLAGQVLTGLGLAALGLAPEGSLPQLDGILSFLHLGWNPLGEIYRILLALATLVQGISGIMIFFLIRARTRKV